MPRFTKHAYVRYLLRNAAIMLPEISVPGIEQSARENLLRSPFISRAQAVRLVGPIAERSWNRYYRADVTGQGVWVTCWHKGEEVVLTYLRAQTYDDGQKAELAWRLFTSRRKLSRRRVVAVLRRLTRIPDQVLSSKVEGLPVKVSVAAGDESAGDPT